MLNFLPETEESFSSRRAAVLKKTHTRTSDELTPNEKPIPNYTPSSCRKKGHKKRTHGRHTHTLLRVNMESALPRARRIRDKSSLGVSLSPRPVIFPFPRRATLCV